MPNPIRDDGFDALDGLTADDVFDIFQDRESNIWVATGGGLDLFANPRLSPRPCRETLMPAAWRRARTARSGPAARTSR